MNMHRETFEEILQMNPKHSDVVRSTTFDKTFRNFGKMFCHSFMFEKQLPPDAQERQRYAEQIAKKYDCKISWHAIYTTSGNLHVLDEVRQELMKTLYVSPIFWVPMKQYNARFCHFKTFAFGFFPYCEKRPFVYDDSVEISTYTVCDRIEFREITDECLDTEHLHKMISQRIKLIRAGAKCKGIVLDKNIPDTDTLYYQLSSDSNYTAVDDAMYPDDMSAQDYFRAVIADNDAEDFVIADYKQIFVRTAAEYRIGGRHDDETMDKVYKLHELLSHRIAVSDIATVDYDGRYCLTFGYDDTALDSVNRHFEFFDTWTWDD